MTKPQGLAPSGAAAFWQVFLPYASGHFLSSLLRNVNAVLAPQLAASAGITPAGLGMLTSVFFFAFALAQLPVGVALDRFGARRVQAAMMLLAACAALAFARGHTLRTLVLARFVLGLGLGGCFMAAVKAMAAWAPPARLPSLTGCLIAAGGLGAAASTLPVRAALGHTDWRGVFVVLGAMLAAAAALVWLAAPRAAAPAAGVGARAGLPEVLREPAFRRIVSLVLLPHMVFFGVQGYWTGRWLSDTARFPDAAVAWLLYLSMAAVVFGAIAVGMVTEWATRRGWAALDVAGCGVALFVCVQLAMLAGVPGAFRLLPVLFALTGCITGMEYALVAQAVPRALTGRAATCLNLMIFLGAFAVQAGVGLIVGCWPAARGGHYPPAAYRAAFAVLVLLQLPGLVKWALSTIRKERHETASLRPAGQGEAGTV